MSYSAYSPSTGQFSAGAALAAADLNGAFAAAVTAFSPGASYTAGQRVAYAGLFWAAIAAVTPGAWNAAQWQLTGFPASPSAPGLLASGAAGAPTWAPRMWVDAREFGVVCDGMTDCGPALQAAINFVASLGGGDVILPPGVPTTAPLSPVYVPASGPTPAVLCNPNGMLPVLVNTGVNINGLVRVIGQGWNETVQAGTLIWTTNTGCTPITINGEAAVGASVERVAFGQNQPAPAAGWAPTVYPPTIFLLGTTGKVTVRDVFFWNVYFAIDNDQSARCELDGIWGQPLAIGIRINYCYDVSHWGRIHFWPFWSEGPAQLAQPARDPNHYVGAWMQAHAHAITLRRVDGVQCLDFFCLGYFAGIYVTSSPNSASGQPGGGAQRVQFGKAYCDACTWSVYFDPASTSPAIIGIDDLRTGSEAYTSGAIPGGGSIYFGGGGCTLSVGQAELFDCAGSPVVFAGAVGANNLMIGLLSVNDINQTVAPGASPAPIFSAPTTTTPNQILIGCWLNEQGAPGGAAVVTASNAWVHSPQNTPLNIPVASGGTAQLVASRAVQLLNTGSAAVSGLTVTLPASFPADGVIVVTCVGTAGITGLTWSAGGVPVYCAQASMVPGQAARLMYINGGSEVEEPFTGWIEV